MITHTDAYIQLRKDSQETLDFVLLVCHGIPSLNAYMKAVDGGRAPALPAPDHFLSPQPHERLREIKKEYRKTLGRLVVLSSFSYFEAYIKDASREIIKFHHPWANSVRTRNKSAISISDPAVIAARSALCEPPKRGKEQKYRKQQKLLLSANFQFPSDLLASFGISTLEHRISKLKATEIPDLLHDAFLFEMSPNERKTFGNNRDLRNEIAHGRSRATDLKVAIGISKWFRDLAKRIDQHLVRNFMVQEPR